MESFGGCKVTVTIVSGNNLKKKFGKGDVTSYVEFRYNFKTYKTKEIKQTPSPIWNDTFHLELVDNDNGEILFKVVDKFLIISDILIGIVRIPVAILREKVPINKWFDIEQLPSQATKDNINSGQINIAFTFDNQKVIKKNEISDDWFLLENNINTINNNTTTSQDSHLSPQNKQVQLQPFQYYQYQQPPISQLQITNQAYPPLPQTFPESSYPYFLPQQQQQLPLSPKYNSNNNRNNRNTTSPTKPLTNNIPETKINNEIYVHLPAQPTQSSPPQNHFQPLQFPSRNQNGINNNNSNTTSSPNLKPVSTSNSNNTSLTNSPKMNGNNLSNSYLNSIIMNFGDSVDAETIELLKATLKEESIYSGKDDMAYLSTCLLCKCKATTDNPLYLTEECLHNFCKRCLLADISTQLKSANCTSINCLASGCSKKITDEILREILVDKEYEIYLNKTLEAVLSGPNIIKCPDPKCGYYFERAVGNASDFKSFDGRKMSEECAKHRLENRFRCGQCSLEFCSSCFKSPYHDYYTCEKYKEYLSSRKCIYCSDRIPNESPSINGVDVCSQLECQEKFKLACTKTHQDCGHHCIGIAGEEKCLPCMNNQCFKKNDYRSDDDELCNICWVESINSAPAIQLDCGHVFHFSCVKDQINKKQGPRILFNNIECVICKKVVSHPAIKNEINSILEFKKRIQIKANERLAFEGLQKSKELEDSKSKYYQNPDAFALDRYVYYKCFKCQQPYFAGAARCDEGNNSYKEDELLCNSCLGVDKNGECKTHGLDYITWKCKFCCNEATYFCWNKTHFCTDCHTRQQKGEYLNKKPIEEIPRCPGPEQCPLKISHPHVEEVILGCSLCKNVNNF